MTDQLKPTPGEWQVADIRGKLYIVDKRGNRIADLPLQHPNYNGEYEANARTLAQALQGLELARAIMDCNEIMHGRILYVQHIAKLARSIVAAVDDKVVEGEK